MKTQVVKIAIIVILINSAGFSQTGFHEHDGFFLRMLYGIGYAELVEKDVLGSDMMFSGSSQALRIQIGGTISDNLIAYGEFGGVILIEPELEWMGQSATASDIIVSVFDFGGGVTYYLMPSNFYFSLSIHTSQASLEYNGNTSESDYGFGINGMIGKEWWIGNDWALGTAVYGYYSTMNDKGDYENEINSFSVGIMFSATYN